jgi:hypothetical protein
MVADLQIHRRRPRKTPMRTRRVGVALYATPAGAAAPEDFPGLDLDAPEDARRRVVSNAVSVLFHAGLLAILALGAYLAPVQEVEELIELQRIDDVQNEPGPAPRVVQERAVPLFDPSRMAVTPQVVNPVVIRRAAPAVQAEKLDVDTINTVQAPREIARTAAVVEQARAYQSPVVATTTPVQVEGVAPAIRGPLEQVAPVGVQSGPRQVASLGNTAGLGDPEALGSGSAVREGLVGGRDVLGARTGQRAEVHWAVGKNASGRGGGGQGSGLGGGVRPEDCLRSDAVQAYIQRVRDRMYQRWALPADVPPDMQVVLRFALDPAGTASRVRLVRSEDPRIGESAVAALRSASPFDPMPDAVRCLAGDELVATFRNPRVTATN